MMQHNMKLQKDPFERISSGEKIIESRLYDEKRQLLSLGDSVNFVLINDPSKSIRVKVIGLLRYSTFSDMISDLGPERFGSSDKKFLLDQLRSFYSNEQENKYGVLGIRFEKS